MYECAAIVLSRLSLTVCLFRINFVRSSSAALVNNISGRHSKPFAD